MAAGQRVPKGGGVTFLHAGQPTADLPLGYLPWEARLHLNSRPHPCPAALASVVFSSGSLCLAASLRVIKPISSLHLPVRSRVAVESGQQAGMEEGSSEHFGLMIDCDWMSYVSFAPSVASRLATLRSPGLLCPSHPASGPGSPTQWEPLGGAGGRVSPRGCCLLVGPRPVDNRWGARGCSL